MTFAKAMLVLRQRKDVRREGRTLRLYPVGFFDVDAGRQTEVTDEDKAAEDWEAVEG